MLISMKYNRKRTFYPFPSGPLVLFGQVSFSWPLRKSQTGLKTLKLPWGNESLVRYNLKFQPHVHFKDSSPSLGLFHMQGEISGEEKVIYSLFFPPLPPHLEISGLYLVGGGKGDKECSELNCYLKDDMSMSWSPDPVIMNLFGKGIFADIIKLRILRWDYPGLSKWVLNPMTCPYQKHRERSGRGSVTIKSDKSDAATSQGTPGAIWSWKGQGMDCPLRTFGGTPALLTPWFQTSGLRNCERIHSYCFKPPSL